jgi:tetratricopeptide (TPR) repeat protein
MKRLRVWLVVLGMMAVVALPASGADRKPATETIDAFVATIKANKDLPAEKVTAAVTAAEELKADPPSQSAAITVGLRELYDEYGTALVDLADENLEAATPKLAELTKHENAYLATDASFFLARAYMLQEKYEEALPLLTKVQKDNVAYTVQHADTAFLAGLCQARLMQRKEAIATFTKFESEFPEAPERMRIGAWRMLQQLQQVKDGTIIDVQDRMDFSRRKLVLKDSGKSTQTEQKKIVEMLAKLIKDAEEKESSGQGQGSGEGKKEGREKSGGENSGQGQGGGGGKEGSTGGHGSGSSDSQDTDQAKRLRRTGPESGWSKLREREREQVFSALKQKYPTRYEKLVEQYYKSFEE